MKKLTLLGFLAVAVAGSLAWADHHEKTHEHGWFDAENCTLCQPWHEHQDVMMSMQWETHKIDGGMLMACNVPEEHLEVYEECCAKMDKKVEAMKAGKQPEHLCGFCTAMGGVMQGGAKMQKVKTAWGTITLITSDKEETVGTIHKMAERTQEEAKKMEEMMKNATKAAVK